jgi:hypothetical protein
VSGFGPLLKFAAMMHKRFFCFLTLLIVAAGSLPAHAWGCEGHQIVALIALKHLRPDVAKQVDAILTASPITPTVRRFCRDEGLPLFAEVSTWADDYRSAHRESEALHFVDIPLSATRDKFEIEQFCKEGCIVAAIGKYAQTLKAATSPQDRADALRFLIHFVGDIHQPLHDADNGDQGGNCVPVQYEDDPVRMTNQQSESFTPNLHSVWDTEMLESMLADRDMSLDQFADSLDRRYAPNLPRWNKGTVTDWAWEGHDLASSFAYRTLPAFVPRDTSGRTAKSCAENNHVGKRMADLHIVLGDRYDSANRPVVEEQLAKAGIRLAALLNSTLRNSGASH